LGGNTPPFFIKNIDMVQGKLFVVGTPIGNLGDITYRAIDCLQSVDLIATEDTRTISKLLRHYGIGMKKLIVYEEFCEQKKCLTILDSIKNGINVALVSEAGTPLISDPGYILVKTAREEGIDVIAIPGVSAVTASLSISGTETDTFTFIGFLPRKSEAKRKYLSSLSDSAQTIIFFESPHRFLDTLNVLVELLPDRIISVCRELTKVHEECISGKPAEVLSTYINNPERLKGEITVVLGKNLNAAEKISISINLDEFIATLSENREIPPSKIASIAARMFNKNKAEIYSKYFSKK
jgi:16S rRNA (cytidine1402-2'-O)-methyltransferase